MIAPSLCLCRHGRPRPCAASVTSIFRGVILSAAKDLAFYVGAQVLRARQFLLATLDDPIVILRRVSARRGTCEQLLSTSPVGRPSPEPRTALTLSPPHLKSGLLY